MQGYPRPAPAFRWYSWWWPMGLINAEEDDWEVIEAEDAAIAAAEAGPQPEPGDLVNLIEVLSDDAADKPSA